MMKRANHYDGIVIGLLISITIITVLSIEFFSVDIYAQKGNVNSNDVQLSKDIFSVQNLIIPDAGGVFSSLQTDNKSKVWMTTGKWHLVSDPSKIGQGNLSSVGFNATIDMKGIDNSNEHRHKVSKFQFADGFIRSTTQGTILTFNGRATIETPLGKHPEVPISIRIIDKNPISLAMGNQTERVMPQWVPGGGTIILSIDQSVQDHFGRTAIYGNVRE